MIDIIYELKNIREKRISLEKEEKKLTAPLLNEIEKLEIVYSIFSRLIKNTDSPPQEGSVLYRQIFIYVALMIYAPNCLIGDKMPKGLRRSIAKILNVRSDQRISDNCSNVRFMHDNYKWFRDSVNYLYAEILYRLNYGNIK